MTGRSVILNADDYGLTPGVSEGIRQAHRQGIVTSTTAMMNMAGVEAALHQAQAECPSLGLGVHLVLTCGGPVLPAGQVPTLTGGTENFPGLDEQTLRLSLLDAQELKAEWRAQIERFIAATGCRPDHIDSHHHVSYFSPLLLQSTLELAQEYDCAVRMPLHTWEGADTTGLPPELLPQIIEFAPPLLKAFAPRCPDHFTAGFYGPSAGAAGLAAILAGLPEGVTEIMCHPGQVDAALLAKSSYTTQRAEELAVLTQAGLREALEQQGIHPVTFSSLPPGL